MSAYLSKSLLNNYRQCPRRPWLDVRDRQAAKQGKGRSAPAEHSADTLKRFAEGHVIGRIAQAMWPYALDIETAVHQQRGDLQRDLTLAAKLTQQAVNKKQAMCEATFTHDRVLVQADVLLPIRGGWQMLEVKSSSAPKTYHITDIATQAWVAEQCGLKLPRLGLVLVNREFELKRAGLYTGLLAVHDDREWQASVREAMKAVPTTIKGARKILAQTQEPTGIHPGQQCQQPYPCPHQNHCGSEPTESAEAMPIRFYRDLGNKKALSLIHEGYKDLAQVPAERIEQLWSGKGGNHAINRRLAQATRTQQAVIDRKGIQTALKQFTWPLQHLDFETINLTAPVWVGTRSGQQVPFQYSVHVQGKNGAVLAHHEYLDTTGEDPRRALAQQLLKDLKPTSTILAWNATFEKHAVCKLAEDLPDLRKRLLRLVAVMEDLPELLRRYYAHPHMVRSPGAMFSIKTLLLLIAPGMGYEQLTGVQNGGDAQATYLRVAAPLAVRQANGYTNAEREEDIANMLRYCGLDTEGMVRVVTSLFVDNIKYVTDG